MESHPINEAYALDVGPATQPSSRKTESAASLFETYFEDVYRFVSRRQNNLEEVKDVVAETFAVAAAKRCPRGVAPRCWLYGIARRKLADSYRKRHRSHTPLDPDMADPRNLESSLAIRRSVEALPQHQRDAFLLQALEDLSVEEIAQVMRRSRTSVKALLQRARETLRNDHNDFLQVHDARK